MCVREGERERGGSFTIVGGVAEKHIARENWEFLAELIRMVDAAVRGFIGNLPYRISPHGYSGCIFVNKANTVKTS